MAAVAEMVVEAVEAAEAAGYHCRHVGADFAAFPVAPSRICSCLCKLFELFEPEVHGAVKERTKVKFDIKRLHEQKGVLYHKSFRKYLLS